MYAKRLKIVVAQSAVDAKKVQSSVGDNEP